MTFFAVARLTDLMNALGECVPEAAREDPFSTEVMKGPFFVTKPTAILPE